MPTSYTLQELAELVAGEVDGDASIRVAGLNSIELAAAGEITFATTVRMVPKLRDCKASAAIVPRDAAEPGMTCIRVADPDHAAAVIHHKFLAGPFEAQGVHPSAQVGSDCDLADVLSVGPLACIGNRVRIGQRVTIGPGVVIGDGCEIGDDCLLHANVTLADRTILGMRVIIHSGTVIGSDGFGYATDQAGHHLKKPQVGNVQIDDDVEIGANTCVDRAAFGTTRIRRGAKIDNLVQVAHNNDIGPHSILVAQVGIAGSTTLGSNCVIGGQAGIAGHLRLGNRVMAAACSAVHTDLEDGAVVGGAPAYELKKWRRAIMAFPRLPDLVRDMRELRKEIEKLSSLLEDADRKRK